VGKAAVVGLGSDRIGGVCGGGIDVCRRHHLCFSAAPPRSVFLPLFSSALQAEARGPAKSCAAWRWQRWFGLRGLRPDLRCSGRRVHCSTGDPTASTRASAAPSTGCGGGHLASYGDFLYSCSVADV
jgi:hypothetical protein